MTKLIHLEFESFALVGSQRSHRGQVRTGPPWSAQVQNMRFPDHQFIAKHANLGAQLLINHGLVFNYPSLRNCSWSDEHQTLCKCCKGDKQVLLKCQISVDDRQNLHNNIEPAFKSGQVNRYYFHGVEVDDLHWVQVPPEHWTPQSILAVPNVDLRRELIRRKGIEQLLDGLFHRTIDTEGDYSLICVILGRDIDSGCNFLKMLNPSIGVWHMEGVPNNIRTVRDALLWRNNGWFVHAQDIT